LSTVAILSHENHSSIKGLWRTNFKTIFSQFKVYAVVGVLLVAFSTPVLAGAFTQVVRSPQQIKYLMKEFYSGGLGDIFTHSNWASANSILKQRLYAELGEKNALEIEDNFFVLGDRPDFYRALSAKPYWLISQYNMSPIREQEKIISEIIERNPRYIIVDKRPEARSFDGIASSVRLYKIYQFLIPKYQLYKSYETFDLLVAEEKPTAAFDYWNSLIGETIELGSIPSAASDPIMCNSSNLKCGHFLKIIPTTTQAQGFNISCRNTRYTVRYNPIPEGGRGWVSLERLWFWDDSCTVDSKSTLQELKGELGNYLY
jgi:hypothetical protein